MCMVHDNKFPDVPIWVGYHVDRQIIEVFFRNGGSIPIDWRVTDDMHNYMLKINKILVIRMEARKPVEGYDTSLQHIRNGTVVTAAAE